MVNHDLRRMPSVRADLDQHVADCDERYEQIMLTIQSVSNRLERMEDLLLEIRNKLPGAAPRMASAHKLLPR